jgi:hypothetical protein
MLYFLESKDGIINWTVSASPLLSKSSNSWDNWLIYRSAMVSNAEGWDIWYSAVGTGGIWHQGRTQVNIHDWEIFITEI